MSTALPAALEGERFEFDSEAGRLSAYVGGSGAPLLLIHSINAAASAAEMQPLYDHYRATRTVFAIDLPGYGFSERSDRRYSPRLMTDAILALLRRIRERCGPAPVDACALSLSCEFLARAAAEHPDAFRSLALISPTGFSGKRSRRAPRGTTVGKPWIYRLLRGPGWGRPLFRALTRPAVIRYFLRRTWGSASIDERLWQYDVISARQPGAQYAPLYFLAAGLFSADIHTVYEELLLPVWLSHGVRGDFTDYRGTAMLSGRANWRISVLATGALPYFERLEQFTREYAPLLE